MFPNHGAGPSSAAFLPSSQEGEFWRAQVSHASTPTAPSSALEAAHFRRLSDAGMDDVKPVIKLSPEPAVVDERAPTAEDAFSALQATPPEQSLTRWTTPEDAELARVVLAQLDGGADEVDWRMVAVAASRAGKSQGECEGRWAALTEEVQEAIASMDSAEADAPDAGPSHSAANPPFTPPEDATLLASCSAFLSASPSPSRALANPSLSPTALGEWTHLQALLRSGRSPRSLFDRYSALTGRDTAVEAGAGRQSAREAENEGKWSRERDQALLQAVAELGIELEEEWEGDATTARWVLLREKMGEEEFSLADLARRVAVLRREISPAAEPAAASDLRAAPEAAPPASHPSPPTPSLGFAPPRPASTSTATAHPSPSPDYVPTTNGGGGHSPPTPGIPRQRPPIVKQAWTPSDEATLISLRRLGHDFDYIASQLPGRNKNSTKAKWHKLVTLGVVENIVVGRNPRANWHPPTPTASSSSSVPQASPAAGPSPAQPAQHAAPAVQPAQVAQAPQQTPAAAPPAPVAQPAQLVQPAHLFQPAQPVHPAQPAPSAHAAPPPHPTPPVQPAQAVQQQQQPPPPAPIAAPPPAPAYPTPPAQPAPTPQSPPHPAQHAPPPRPTPPAPVPAAFAPPTPVQHAQHPPPPAPAPPAATAAHSSVQQEQPQPYLAPPAPFASSSSSSLNHVLHPVPAMRASPPAALAPGFALPQPQEAEVAEEKGKAVLVPEPVAAATAPGPPQPAAAPLAPPVGAAPLLHAAAPPPRAVPPAAANPPVAPAPPAPAPAAAIAPHLPAAALPSPSRSSHTHTHSHTRKRKRPTYAAEHPFTPSDDTLLLALHASLAAEGGSGDKWKSIGKRMEPRRDRKECKRRYRFLTKNPSASSSFAASPPPEPDTEQEHEEPQPRKKRRRSSHPAVPLTAASPAPGTAAPSLLSRAWSGIGKVAEWVGLNDG
ncbi:hypothetical protein JCM10213_002335 [Rhodosporidiobolus nylandii]